ncbi:MAG: 4-alpha-glucanotransferase [Xanthomonas sp.]|nr:4-alpha-glucanotransferase [Xanthomonas sp.]
MSDADIVHLAEAAGFRLDWIDASGTPQKTGAGSLRSILAAMDLRCETAEQCRDSHARLAQQKAQLPPLITGRVDTPLRMPAQAGFAGKNYRIECEDGTGIDGRFSGDAEPELPPLERYGYHRLLTGDTEITLAIAPARCFGVDDAVRAALQGAAPAAARLWGLGVQLYGLRRQGDGGIGDFTALGTLARAAAAHGAAALAISPVHAMFSADVTRFSPYGPSSRLFLNALHIDPAAVRGEDALAAAIAASGSDAASRLAQLEQEDLIDWPAAATLRLELLRRLYRQFIDGNDERGEFDAFRAGQGEALQAHARFEALHAWRLAHGEDGYWRNWPDALRNPRSAEVEDFARQHADEVGFHEFLQWQAARGLAAAQKSARDAGMPIGLVSDLAVGADNGGSQAWSRQQEIMHGLSVGAPPDAMNPRGQSWGLGAFSPHAMRARGFHAYIEMLRSAFAHAGGVRIDHVLGLSRLWLVPDGASSDEGAYLRYPMEDLLRLIALESWRHRSIVIGEDLGTVPPGFDALLAQSGLLGIRVLLFQRDGTRFFRPDEWPDSTIATTTTHDLPTIAGWWAGRDLDWRSKLDLLETGQTEAAAREARERDRASLWQALTEAGCANGEPPSPNTGAAPLDAAIGFIAATPAPLAMLPVEDALGLTEQPNLPGTIAEHPNWRRRLPQPVDTLLTGTEVSKRLALLNRSRSFREKS